MNESSMPPQDYPPETEMMFVTWDAILYDVLEKKSHWAFLLRLSDAPRSLVLHYPAYLFHACTVTNIAGRDWLAHCERNLVVVVAIHLAILRIDKPRSLLVLCQEMSGDRVGSILSAPPDAPPIDSPMPGGRRIEALTLSVSLWFIPNHVRALPLPRIDTRNRVPLFPTHERSILIIT